MAKAKQTVKRGRGRPALEPLNFNFGKTSFTIDRVLARYHGKVSRAAVYNQIQDRIGKKQMREVGRVAGDGRGHPTYQYKLARIPRKVSKTVAVTAPVAE